MADERDFSLLKELRVSQEERRRKRQVSRKIIRFSEYLNLIEAGEERHFPNVQSRLWNAVLALGVTFISKSTDPQKAQMYGLEDGEILPHYHAFDEFVGLDDVIDDFLSTIHAPVLLPGTSEEERQAPILVGPTGSGKSRFVDRLIRILEDSGSMWRIYGCPHNDKPLYLFPRHLRPRFDDPEADKSETEALTDSARRVRLRLKELNLSIEGDLCPICRERLLHGWEDVRLPDGNPLPWAPSGFKGGVPLEDFPVEKTEFSKRSATGYYEVPLTDEEELDPSPLIGRIDLAKIPIFGSESAVGALTLDGGFNKANQGIIEFPEIFKRSRRALKILINATQDKMVPLPGSHGHVSVDILTIGHSNWEEFSRFRRKEARNEALMRRFMNKFFRYNLFLSEEVDLLNKRIRRKDGRDIFDIAPHTVEVVASLAIMSRFKPSPLPNVSPLQKMAVLNGEAVSIPDVGRFLRPADVRHPEDGLEEAISFREEMKLFGRLFHRLRLRNKALRGETGGIIPVIPAEALGLLPLMVEEVCRAHSFLEEKRKTLESYIELIRQEYHWELEIELRAALIPNFSDIVDQFFLKYVQHCEAWVKLKTKGEKIIEPDEDYLKWIEAGFPGGAKNIKEFRLNKAELYWKLLGEGKEIHYRDLGEGMQQAFETAALREIFRRMRALHSQMAATEEDREKYRAAIEHLKQLGYSDLTAPLVIDYYATSVFQI